MLRAAGAGKITQKAPAKNNHAVGLTFALWNRQALSLLSQVSPFLCSYKRLRAELVLQQYVRLTPRNGKYTDAIKSERREFENAVLAIRARIGGRARSPEMVSTPAE